MYRAAESPCSSWMDYHSAPGAEGGVPVAVIQLPHETSLGMKNVAYPRVRGLRAHR